MTPLDIYTVVMLITVTAIFYMALVCCLYELSEWAKRERIGSKQEPKDETDYRR